MSTNTVPDRLAETDPDKYRRLTIARAIGLANSGLSPVVSLQIAQLVLSPEMLTAIGLTRPEIEDLYDRHQRQRDKARDRAEEIRARQSEEREIKLARILTQVDALNREFPDLDPVRLSNPPTA